MLRRRDEKRERGERRRPSNHQMHARASSRGRSETLPPGPTGATPQTPSLLRDLEAGRSHLCARHAYLLRQVSWGRRDKEGAARARRSPPSTKGALSCSRAPPRNHTHPLWILFKASKAPKLALANTHTRLRKRKKQHVSFCAFQREMRERERLCAVSPLARSSAPPLGPADPLPPAANVPRPSGQPSTAARAPLLAPERTPGPSHA